ncbi:unnamed protein product [Rotaria magnacalcarata]|uniref:Uncharacterized protein n=1 Tax=Rotaria magnacalcarata TaxID=392030 RepID=A0A816KG20_9BILA|nr:unnamed protein product [Rotaria magnacalcarata]CAF5195690.1 unnamed protein product [Rotaria magnacalcarata]
MQSSTANINHGHKPGEISVSIFGQNDDDNDDDDDYDSRGVKEFSQYNYDLTKNTFNIDCDNVDDNQIILLGGRLFIIDIREIVHIRVLAERN